MLCVGKVEQFVVIFEMRTNLLRYYAANCATGSAAICNLLKQMLQCWVGMRGECGEDEQGKPMGKQLAKWALRMNDLDSSFGSLLTCVVDRRRMGTFLGIEIFVHTA